MDYLKYNQAVIPTAAAVPDVWIFFFSLKQINSAPWTWCKAVNLENVFVSIIICKVHQQCACFYLTESTVHLHSLALGLCQPLLLSALI